jgi:REP element-mobilizing transposase RayT
MVYAQARRGRLSLPGQVYLLTIATFEAQAVFTDFHCARAVVNEMRRLHDTALVSSLAWVVMPDHIQWLLALGHTHALAIVVKMLKGRTAMAANRAVRRRSPVWQTGYHEHVLREAEDLTDIARYIVANPVRARLVRRVGDYPHWDAIWL